MNAAIISTNASSDTGRRAIKSEVGIMQRHRRRLGYALKRGFRFGSTTTTPAKQEEQHQHQYNISSIVSSTSLNKKPSLQPFSRASSRRRKSGKCTAEKNTVKGNDTTPICMTEPLPTDTFLSEHAPLFHPSSSGSINASTMELEPPFISSTLSTIQIANTADKELTTTSSTKETDVEKQPNGTTTKSRTLTLLATSKQDFPNYMMGDPSFETLDTASRMMSEQTLGEKVIEDLTGAFGGIGVFQRAFNALKFEKRSEPSASQIENDTEEQDTNTQAEPSIALDTASKSNIDSSTIPDKIDSMNSQLTDSGSSNGSSNINNLRSYIFHLWSGDFPSMGGAGHSKSMGLNSNSSSSSSSSATSATSSSGSHSDLTGAIITPQGSVRSRISQKSGSTGGTDALFMQYSNTEYSEASEITTSSKSSFASGSRSSFKSVDESTVASSVATNRSTTSQSIDSDSVFVNRICEGVRTRIPDRASKLTAVESEDLMNRPDTSREQGEASHEGQESMTSKTSVSSGVTSSTSGRSTGSHGSSSSEILVYKMSKRSLSKAKSGYLLPVAKESNIEVVAKTGSMDTESTSSTKRSTNSAMPGGARLLVATKSLLKSMSSRRSPAPEIDGHAVILSWNSV